MTRILVICSEFNIDITQSLLRGAMSHFEEQKIPKEHVEIIWVPGAFEIPTVAAVAAQSKRFSAIVTLGAVVKGDTSHYELVVENCARKLADIGVASGMPVIFGVLATLNLQQAYERSGIKGPNHGVYYAEAALKMMSVMSKLKGLSHE